MVAVVVVVVVVVAVAVGVAAICGCFPLWFLLFVVLFLLFFCFLQIHGSCTWRNVAFTFLLGIYWFSLFFLLATGGSGQPTANQVGIAGDGCSWRLVVAFVCC